MNGVDIPIMKMYPSVVFPVTAGTPMISSLVRWDHSEDWFLAKFDTMKDGKSGERICKLALADHDFEYVSGHVIDGEDLFLFASKIKKLFKVKLFLGRVLFPATGYLYLVWETLGMMKGTFYVDLELEFQDVQFLRATAMQKDTEVTFIIMIHRGTGRFEVMLFFHSKIFNSKLLLIFQITEGDSPVVTGYVKTLENSKLTPFAKPPLSTSAIFDTRDFYKELRLRGYHYSGEFKSVVEARSDGLGGKIKWNLNFASFMDCMLQLIIVGKDTRDLLIPTAIERLRINPMQHFEMAKSFGDCENAIFDVNVCEELNLIQCGGIEIQGLKANAVGRRKPPGVPVLETYQFVSHLPSKRLSVKDACRMIVQLGLENAPGFKIKSVEVDNAELSPIVHYIHEALGDLPLVVSEALYLTNKTENLPGVHVEDGKLSSLTNCTFVIASNWTTNLGFVEAALPSLKDTAYLITREAAGLDFSNLIPPPSCKLICSVPIENEMLVVFQYQKLKMFGVPTVIKINSKDTDYEWIKEVQHAVTTGPVYLVSQNEPYSGILGLVNCLRREPVGQLVTGVFIDDPQAPPFDPENPLYKKQLRLGLAINVYRDGMWGSYRHLTLDHEIKIKPETKQCFANALSHGDLTSLKWLETSPFTSNPDKTLVRIKYSSLNFRDVMLATGKLSSSFIKTSRGEGDCVLGLEFSGITSKTQRVMGMIDSGALATHVQADSDLLWECPENWSLEEAATVPIVYSTVYSALFLAVKIEKGKKILIHAGTGGVGLAAIRVALAYGLEVFTTVSTQEKRNYLLEQYPKLKESHIGNSRDTSFYNMIMFETNGKGVDYVLNSLSEEKLKTSIKCLGRGGKFLEIGKFDIANDNKIGLAHFMNEISFHAILLDNLFTEHRERKRQLRDYISKDIRSGIIVPLRRNIFMANEVEQAFRFLASGRHIGKIMLKIRENDLDDESLPISCQLRTYCDPYLSYIIPGGLGGFGLELADWLVTRGCRKLVLSSSRGITRPYQTYRIM